MNHSHISFSKLGLIFTGLYLLIAALALALVIALEVFFNYTFDSNFLAGLAPMLAAMQAGSIWFNRTGTRPSNGVAWKAALMFALIALAIGIIVALGLYQAGMLPELKDLWLYPDGKTILAVVLGVTTLLVLLLCRFGFGLGARQAAKLKEKLDRKAAE